jgi:hypothetical protein
MRRRESILRSWVRTLTELRTGNKLRTDVFLRAVGPAVDAVAVTAALAEDPLEGVAVGIALRAHAVRQSSPPLAFVPVAGPRRGAAARRGAGGRGPRGADTARVRRRAACGALAVKRGAA